jgi:charged multivesicular body protein 7
LSITIGEDLLRQLETPTYGRPLALGTVVRDAVQNREMMGYNDFMAAKVSIYQNSWSGVPLKILKWGFSQVAPSILGNNESLPTGSFVILSNVELAGKEVLEQVDQFSSRVGRIYSKDMFQEEFGHVFSEERALSSQDMEVLLKYLSRDKGAVAYDGNVVKFSAPSEPSPPTITSEDVTIANLKTLMVNLGEQVESLSTKIDQLSNTAREAVAKKNRTAALAALRSKKLAETNLEKRTATLHQLEEVYTSIEQAADQVQMVKIMEGSTNVLKSLNKEVGGVDRVDDVVAELSEQMMQVGEVEQIIADAGQTTSIDEGEVDEELEAMEAEERKQEEEKKEQARKVAQEEKERVEAAETQRKLGELKTFEEASGKETAAPTEATADDPDAALEEKLQRLAL